MMTNNNKLKIAVFADVQNIYYTTKEAYQRQFNYRNFWKKITQYGDVVIANAYAIARQDDQQHKFQTALRHIGFNVELKPFIQRSDGSAKGDWDVGITIDVLEAAPNVDLVVLLSGDGDFDLLMKKVSDKYQCETWVYGVPSLTARSLIESVTDFYPIDSKLLM